MSDIAESQPGGTGSERFLTQREETPARTPLALSGLLGIGFALAALEVASGWVEPWGLFHDELYYWAGGRRLGLGYVDHPPLAPWLLAATQTLFGDGRTSFAIVPALSAAAVVVLTGRLAQLFGADRFGQLLAGLAVAITPVYLIFFSFYSVNAIELLLWTAACVIAAEVMRSGDGRWWLAFGAVSGVALLNKHTYLLLPLALAVGIVSTPLREALRTRWLWLGIAAAIFIALPNLIWNALNDWPSLQFYSGRSVGVLPATPGAALEIQFLGAHPLNALLWIPGVCFLLFSRAARPFRPLGIAFLVLFVAIVFSGQRRGDRIAGIYPVALAAGAVVWSRLRPRWRSAMRSAIAVLLLASGVLLLPVSLPLLSPQGVEAYFEAIDDSPEIEVGDVGAGMPLYLSGRLEWERFAGEVLAVWRSLPEEERERAVILTPHWLFAAVIEYYSRNEAHPPVVSPHNAYYFWRADAGERDIVVAVAIPREVLAEFFEETREGGFFECAHCVMFRQNMSIVVATSPARPLQELIESWRDFDILPAAALRRESDSWPRHRE